VKVDRLFPLAQVVPFPQPAPCRHPSWRCSAERRGAYYVLVCPCGNVRVCLGDSDAALWALVDQNRLAREIRDARIKGIARSVQQDVIEPHDDEPEAA
jgi:hypothetical protein